MDFTRLLRLPLVFSQKYGSILPENVKLRTSSGDTWDVKLEQMEDNRHCFARGWNKFAGDVGLEMMEFLVFSFVGKSTFNVSVYGIKGRERGISGSKFQAEDSDPDEVHLESSKDSESNHSLEEERSLLYCKFCLKQHHRSRVTLPKKFWVAAGLLGKEAVMPEYLPKHYYQAVKLDMRDRHRIDMAGGWHEFRKANGIVLGKTYIFEFKPRKNVVQVKELKKEN